MNILLIEIFFADNFFYSANPFHKENSLIREQKTNIVYHAPVQT